MKAHKRREQRRERVFSDPGWDSLRQGVWACPQPSQPPRLQLSHAHLFIGTTYSVGNDDVTSVILFFWNTKDKKWKLTEKILQYISRQNTEKHRFFFPIYRHLKAPYCRKFTVQVFSNHNMCLYLVNEVPRNKESPSFSSTACSTFEKVCAKARYPGN